MTEGVERILLSVSDRTALMIAPKMPLRPICVATPPKPPVAFIRLSTAACCNVLASWLFSVVVVVVTTPPFTVVVVVLPNSFAPIAPASVSRLGEALE